MKVLLITNKNDITTDFIVKKLKERRVKFYRFNTEEIGNSVQLIFDFDKEQYKILDRYLNIEIDLLNIAGVYFRRPEININANTLSTGEINFVRSEHLFSLEGLYKILGKAFWINTVSSIRNAENKIYQLLLAKDIGLNIPNSIVTNNSSSALSFYNRNNNSCIIKPIKSGLVEGHTEEGVIFTSKVDFTDQNISRTESCPIYLQNLIKKKGDVRVTVVGNITFAAFIHSQASEEAQIDWRKNIYPLRHSIIDLPHDIVDKCLLLTKKLSLNFGAIDFVLNENNEYLFLEINPNGQWAWIEKQLDFPISDAITNLLIENIF